MMRHTVYGFMPLVGKLQCQPFALLLDALRGRNIKIEVSDAKPTRSTQQNRYYWGVVVWMIWHGLKEAGWDLSREETHEMLRVRFLSEDRPLNNDGEFATVVRSTTDLSTEEFVAYTDQCVRFAAEYLGVVIPPPNEQMSITA